MLAHAARSTQIIGTLYMDRAKQGGDLGRTLTLIDGLMATATGNVARRLGRDCQLRQASEQAGAKLFEQVDQMVFELSQAVFLLAHQVLNVRVSVAMRSVR